MQSIMSDPSLLAGFDDPQVMAAVAEVAQDPSAFKKHQSNPKVSGVSRAVESCPGNWFHAPTARMPHRVCKLQ